MSNRISKLLLLAALGAAMGCSSLDNCPDGAEDGEPPVTIDTGDTLETAVLLYQSSPPNGPFDLFPAKTTLRFVHGLGATPELVTSALSFSPQGSWSENAGNQGLVTCIDDEVIDIKNDTCESEFYIRVVAIATGETTGSPACE